MFWVYHANNSLICYWWCQNLCQVFKGQIKGNSIVIAKKCCSEIFLLKKEVILENIYIIAQLLTKLFRTHVKTWFTWENHLITRNIWLSKNYFHLLWMVTSFSFFPLEYQYFKLVITNMLKSIAKIQTFN